MARNIRFTRTHERFGDFTDAITVDDNATDAQITALQDERFANWVGYLENPPVPPADGQAIDAAPVNQVVLVDQSLLVGEVGVVDPAIQALDAIWGGQGTDEDYATVRAKLGG